jgi:hemolysin III
MSIGQADHHESDAPAPHGFAATFWAAEEELVNAITHGLGLALAIAGLAVMVTLAVQRGTAWHIVGCSVYGVSLVAVYAASTIYHSVTSSRWKAIFRTIDHACIFLMIAGSYTPFTLTVLRGTTGWILFGLVWTCAILGTLQKVLGTTSSSALSTAAYIVMGWSAVFAIRPIMANMDWFGFGLLLSGGLCYTLGVFFYVRDNQRYYHAVWHIFVLAGSVCHFGAVMHSVIPSVA